MKSLEFFKPTLVTTLAIVFAWLPSIRPAQAGYIVTLQQVGPNVVATGSGAINLTGLTIFGPSTSLFNPEIFPGAGVQAGGNIVTGPTSSSADLYSEPRGPTSFGSGGVTLASSGSGDIVGILPGRVYPDLFLRFLIVPRGYVSGTFLSNSATYSGKTIATLGVTPGTYVWTWGIARDQNFTLQILAANPTPTPTPTEW